MFFKHFLSTSFSETPDYVLTMEPCYHTGVWDEDPNSISYSYNIGAGWQQV